MKRKQEIFTILLIGVIAACAAVVYISVDMSVRVSLNYLFLLAFLIPLGAAAWLAYRRMGLYRMLVTLERVWAEKQSRKRNFADIREMTDLDREESPRDFYIDDQTWEDLNMDQVFEELDRTLTIPGEQVLYNILRQPAFDSSILVRRDRTIKLFQEDGKAREEIFALLYKLGRERDIRVTSLMWGRIPPMSPFRILFSVLALAALVSVLLIPLYGVNVLIITTLPLFGINFFISHRIKKEILSELTSLRYLGGIINTARKAGKSRIPGLEEYASALKAKADACSKILRKTGMLVPFQPGDMVEAVYEYINVLFLIEVRSFYSALNEIEARRQDLREIYFLIGELDALMSTASYRSGLKSFSVPQLSHEGTYIEACDMRHPLLKDPIPNSITVDREGIIITGCNMSGKSTFLRTLGVNALFAQTICTCLASSYMEASSGS